MLPARNGVTMATALPVKMRDFIKRTPFFEIGPPRDPDGG